MPVMTVDPTRGIIGQCTLLHLNRPKATKRDVSHGTRRSFDFCERPPT
jgi:hypothetical protein